MARERFDGQTPFNPGTYGGVMHTDDRWDDNGVRLDDAGNPVGNIIKGNKSGEEMDRDRFQSIGKGMQERDPYKFDWSQADKDRAAAQQSGDLQGDANEQWRKQATGEDKTSFMYGRSLVDRGAQNQQAAALSTAGDPLAQAGASINAQQSRGAFTQKGMQGVQAQQADDMATGRAGYAQGLAQQRKLDQTGQSLSDQQTELQAAAAAQQRKLNDAGQYGMDKMTTDMHQQALSGRQQQAAITDKMRADREAANQADRDRAIGYVSAGINAIPVAGPALNAATAPAASEASDPSSDERVKDIQPANALLSMIQPSSKMGSGPEPEGTEANTAPSITGYDTSMHKKNDPAPRTWGTEPKENPDDKGAPNTEALHKGIEKSIKYGRDPEDIEEKPDPGKMELGVAGAPKGYAASRRGKAGDMFGGGPSGQGAYASSWDADHGMAPGTRDVLKYGTPSARSERDMDDFSKAVMTSGMEAKEPAFLNPNSTSGMEAKQPAFLRPDAPSDERAKNKQPAPTETPEQKKAREDKEDAEETAKFMGDVPKGAVTVKKPESYEEASKRIDERNEQDRQIKAAQQKSREDEGASYMRNQDAELIRRNNENKWVPGFIKRWSNEKIMERQKNRTPEENIKTAVERDKADQEATTKAAERKDAFDSSPYIHPATRQFIDKLKPTRQPTSFTREQAMSDERAKNIVGLRQEEGGIEQHWDQDVDTNQKAKSSSSGASLSGPTPKYNSPKEAPSAAKPAPGKPKTRKYTDDELKKIGDDMLANTRAQTEAQTSAGPSTQGAIERSKSHWLDDYMTSDEDSKSKGGNALIEMQKDANRKLRGETYTYKEGFGEDTDQVHHGFMAQNLEKNPITATAVREDGTGIKKVNNEDALRVTAAGVASLQEQQDELDKAIDALVARRGKKRVA